MGIFAPDLETLRELYQAELENALNMEKQIVEKGLPAMIENATDTQLKGAFRTHLEESRQHVSRLESILSKLHGEVTEGNCKVMSALISSGGSMAKDAGDSALRDVILIAAGNQVEHHEIAVYGTLATWADVLGEDAASALLEKTLEEEKNADKVLSELSDQINVEAPVA